MFPNHWCRGLGGKLLTEFLDIACSDYFLIGPRTPSPWMMPPSMALLHQSLNKKIPYRQVLWRHFLNWGSFLSGKRSLCQVDIKFFSTLEDFFFLLACLFLSYFYFKIVFLTQYIPVMKFSLQTLAKIPKFHPIRMRAISATHLKTKRHWMNNSKIT